MASGKESNNKKMREFLARTADVMGRGPNETIQLLATKPKTTFWMNQLKPGVQPLREVAPLFGLKDAFSTTAPKVELVASAGFEKGEFYIQNTSSMIAVEALDLSPGQSLLDLCCSPGGKAARSASLTKGDLELWANDSIESRIKKMQSVFELLGVSPKEITTHPAQYASKFIDQQFDRILIDAQCTGEASINPEKPGTISNWSIERVEKYSYLQQRMLMSAWKLLKPGGRLVYSTCTFSPNENEAPVSHLLKHTDDSTVIPFRFDEIPSMPGLTGWQKQKFDQSIKGALRILPGEFTEGFFVGVLEKA